MHLNCMIKFTGTCDVDAYGDGRALSMVHAQRRKNIVFYIVSSAAIALNDASSVWRRSEWEYIEPSTAVICTEADTFRFDALK